MQRIMLMLSHKLVNVLRIYDFYAVSLKQDIAITYSKSGENIMNELKEFKHQRTKNKGLFHIAIL